jgi:hypothetical protein
MKFEAPNDALIFSLFFLTVKIDETEKDTLRE